MEDVILDCYSLCSLNHCEIAVMYFFPNFNKTPLKFPIPRVWVMFPKYWKKAQYNISNSSLQNECDQLHRFSMVVRDLQKCETVAFKTAVMTFINTLINCTPTVMERVRIRNEFIGKYMLYLVSIIRLPF